MHKRFTWPKIIMSRNLLPTLVDPSDPPDESRVASRSKPFGVASPKEMLNALMNCANVSAETRLDLRDYPRPLTGGRLSPTIRANIQALYGYAILGSRQA